MKKHSKKFVTADKCLYILEKGEVPDATCPEGAVIAEVDQQINFNAKALDTFDVKGFQPIHYDLLMLCAAVEFADRGWKRPRSWSRNLHVIMPVTNLETWQNPDVLKSLQSILGHLTCDSWKFTFVQANNPSPIGSRQIPLDFSKTKTFAVAYSEGLDSRAVSALSGNMDEALCIRVTNQRARRKRGENFFTQIPFKVEGHGSKESSFRSRGFQFSVVTAIAAHLSNVSRIMVTESGQGALGPVLLPLHKVYADYRNHPTSFRKIEKFIKATLGYKIQFEQPRLWSTKGQTLRAFLDLPGKSKENLTSTRSCWQKRRIVNAGSRKQCGLCAACLLRRLSFHAAGIDEAPDTYVISDLSASDVNNALSAISQKSDRDIMIEYGSVGARHLQHLADMASLSDDALRVHASEIAVAITATNEETLKNLKNLLAMHSQEWQAFLSTQGEKSFLKSWMDGGRNDRFE